MATSAGSSSPSWTASGVSSSVTEVGTREMRPRTRGALLCTLYICGARSGRQRGASAGGGARRGQGVETYADEAVHRRPGVLHSVYLYNTSAGCTCGRGGGVDRREKTEGIVSHGVRGD